MVLRRNIVSDIVPVGRVGRLTGKALGEGKSDVCSGHRPCNGQARWSGLAGIVEKGGVEAVAEVVKTDDNSPWTHTLGLQ
mgnify:CR=1 FL=1